METEGAWALESSIKYLNKRTKTKPGHVDVDDFHVSHLIHNDVQQELIFPFPLTVVAFDQCIPCFFFDKQWTSHYFFFIEYMQFSISHILS